MAVIKLQSTFIEFPFQNAEGEEVLNLKFDKSDKNLKKLSVTVKELKKKTEELKEKDTLSEKEVKQFIKDSVDTIFGQGSFDAMYQLSPSLVIVTDYFFQMAEGVFEECNEDKYKEKMEKYL